MNTRLLLIVGFLVAAIVGVLVHVRSSEVPAAPMRVQDAGQSAALNVATTTGADVSPVPKQSPLPAAFATLIVDEDQYRIAEAGILLDSMQSLRATGDLSFSGKEHPGLGFFVESVNGKKAADGYNWMLYVNDKESSTGASQTRISRGDSIEWKYEN